MARVRNYAAEYARRLELHPENITAARGHGTRERESVERGLRRLFEHEKVRVDESGEIVRRWEQGGKKPTTRGMIDRYGQENLRRMLREQKEASRAFERGDTAQARRLWEERDPSLPEFLFWYHGMFG